MSQMPALDWNGYSNELQIETALSSRFENGTNSDVIVEYMQSQGCECSDMVNGVVHCSHSAPRTLRFTDSKWLIRFFFDNGGLKKIEVEKGYVGL